MLRDQAVEDYAAATAQIHYPYLTRLRTSMLVDYLDQDLQLALAEDSTDVDRELYAQRDINYECNETAVAGVTGSSRGGSSGGGQLLLLVVFALLVYTTNITPRAEHVRRIWRNVRA